MKVNELFEGGLNSKVQKPKPRPKSNLWFRDEEFWLRDLKNERGKLAYHEDEEDNVYATDADNKFCYGYWNNKKCGGMTFFKPMPFSHYSHRHNMIRREV